MKAWAVPQSLRGQAGSRPGVSTCPPLPGRREAGGGPPERTLRATDGVARSHRITQFLRHRASAHLGSLSTHALCLSRPPAPAESPQHLRGLSRAPRPWSLRTRCHTPWKPLGSARSFRLASPKPAHPASPVPSHRNKTGPRAVSTPSAS